MRRTRRAFLALAALWTVGAAVALFLPAGLIGPTSGEWSALAHVVFFGVATTLWTAALPGRARRVGAVALALAVLSEGAQAAFGAGRAAEGVDLVADAVGVVGGLALGVVLPYVLPRRR